MISKPFAFGGLLPTYLRGIWSFLGCELPIYPLPSAERPEGQEKDRERRRVTKEKDKRKGKKKRKEKKRSTGRFPRVPPPQYYPGSNLLTSLFGWEASAFEGGVWRRAGSCVLRETIRWGRLVPGLLRAFLHSMYLSTYCSVSYGTAPLSAATTDQPAPDGYSCAT